MIKSTVIKKTFVLTLIIIAFQSCSLYKPVNIGNIEGVDVEEISLKKITLNVRVPIENPNFYKLKVRKYKLVLSVNGQKLTNLDNKKRIIIPAKSHQTISFPVDIEFKEILSNGAKVLMEVLSKRTVNMEVEGKIKAGAGIFSKSFKIKENGSYDIFK